MHELDSDLRQLRVAAARGRVSDELWSLAWHAAVVARTLIPAPDTAAHDTRLRRALDQPASRLLALAQSAADMTMLRDRLLGYELHTQLAKRRDAAAADVPEWREVNEPSLSRALALLTPAESEADAAALRPWAAMLAGSGDVGASAASRARALSKSPARFRVIDELFSAVDAGQPPPTPPASSAFNDPKTIRPQPGDLWLTVARPAAAFVLILPFDAVRDDAVVLTPVDFHWQAAGPTDLVLQAKDSSFECDMRAVLGLEALVHVADLESRVGSVEPDLIRQIANATVPDERYGTSLAAEQDPRLLLDAPLRSALLDLERSASRDQPSEAPPRDAEARHPLSELWATFAEVWDPNHVPELVELMGALPAAPHDAVNLAEVIARRRLHESARDIAFGRGAVAAGKTRGVTRLVWPLTHDSVPELTAQLVASEPDLLLTVEGLPSDLEGQSVLIVLAQGYRRQCPWWHGLKGVLAPTTVVARGRVEAVLAEGALRTRDLAGIAIVPGPPSRCS